MHYDYWFTYEGYEIETILLRDILSVKVLNLKFKKDGTCNPVLFQIHTHFWNQFQQQFSIKEVVERSEDYITVW